MNVSDALIELLEEARMLKKVVTDKLNSAPDGYLRLTYYRGETKYYHRLSADDNTGVYLGKDKENELRALEERDYLRKLSKVLSEREEILSRILKKLEEMPSADAVFYDIPDDKRHLIEPVSAIRKMTDEEIAKWDKLNRRKTPSIPRKLYVTSNGEKVRSKSEVIIADRFRVAGVPYLYESMLDMTDEYFFHSYQWTPDFKVLNKRTRNEYYWEHFGMLDDAEYCAASLFKMETYAEFGLFPGCNLIITAESKEHPLNTEYVDRLISKYLL